MSRESVIRLIEKYMEENKERTSIVGFWFTPLKLRISNKPIQLGFTHRHGKLILGVWDDQEWISIHRDRPRFELTTDALIGGEGHAEEVYIRIKNKVNKS